MGGRVARKSANMTNGDVKPSVRVWHVVLRVLISALYVGGSVLILLFPILPAPQYRLGLGDIVQEDIRAPRRVTYISQIETQAAQEAAAANVNNVYDPPDPRIGRGQVRQARQIMAFIRDVRADPFADSELKEHYLAHITALSGLKQEVSTTLLTMSDSQFDLVDHEISSLVEEAMSGTVKEGLVEDVTGQLELKVSSDLPEDLITPAVAVSRKLIVPNSMLNVAETEARREAAVDAVPIIEHTFQPDEIVIRAGEVVDDLDLEALKAIGYGERQMTREDILSALLAGLLSASLMVVYLTSLKPFWSDEPAYLLIVVVMFLIFLAIAQIMVPGETIIAYLFPAAALGLSMTALVGVEFAALSSVVLAGMVGYMADGSLEIAVFSALSSMLAAGTLRRPTRLNAFFLAGVFAAMGGVVVLLIFRLPDQIDATRLWQLLLMAVLNGLLSAGIALVVLFVVGSLTGLTTSLRLIDLMRPDHPLQRRLQQEILGTYQHTLSVANLAEAAAEAIGADSLLTRVGTLYHDIGKISNPGFFVENRVEGGPDPHQDLSPLSSARLIRAHVSEGVELARRYRLPPQVVAFIPEHHGTMPISFFLHKAREEADQDGTQLSEEEEQGFYYDGPTPQSRETAILMLADGCESATRANRPGSREEIEEIVTRIIQQRIDRHQLDSSGLTLDEIKTIRDTFVRTLGGMYHPRVKYPEDKQPSPLPSGQSPAVQIPGGSEIPPSSDSSVAGQDTSPAGDQNS